ncbi:hypothetical protein B0H16DRAFT_1702698 [Mycena metata]|uniref:Uncharacterized protein n=1 Tax=Mycena metata TaxID=1033252 RepID=A0AAD7MEJ5_9AGAR|nr:hypothetical protein B0H16DRAFT_1702698 [Mycena metata]
MHLTGQLGSSTQIMIMHSNFRQFIATEVELQPTKLGSSNHLILCWYPAPPATQFQLGGSSSEVSFLSLQSTHRLTFVWFRSPPSQYSQYIPGIWDEGAIEWEFTELDLSPHPASRVILSASSPPVLKSSRAGADGYKYGYGEGEGWGGMGGEWRGGEERGAAQQRTRGKVGRSARPHTCMSARGDSTRTAAAVFVLAHAGAGVCTYAAMRGRRTTRKWGRGREMQRQRVRARPQVCARRNWTRTGRVRQLHSYARQVRVQVCANGTRYLIPRLHSAARALCAGVHEGGSRERGRQRGRGSEGVCDENGVGKDRGEDGDGRWRWRRYGERVHAHCVYAVQGARAHRCGSSRAVGGNTSTTPAGKPARCAHRVDSIVSVPRLRRIARVHRVATNGPRIFVVGVPRLSGVGGLIA